MENKKDLNPLGLEIGKHYWLRYVHGDCEPHKVLITRFTKDGYPWQQGKGISGIVSGDCYELIGEATTWDEVGRRYAKEMFGEDKTLSLRFLDWCKEYFKAPELLGCTYCSCGHSKPGKEIKSMIDGVETVIGYNSPKGFIEIKGFDYTKLSKRTKDFLKEHHNFIVK